jgi:LytR cell envelope-related transcriptional attenuator
MVPERSTARANPARGLALIATAVIIGFFLLRNGWDQSVPDVSAADAAEQATGETGGAPPASGGDTTATTAPPATHPVGEVSVRVVNTAGVNGAGACMTDQLAQRGYVTVDATNAEPEQATTAVQFAEGYQADAAALLALMQVEGEPAPIATPPPADPGGAQLLVMLGTDLAAPC